MSLGFHTRLTKIDFEKIASKDFLPLLPPKKKQKIMDVPFAMMQQQQPQQSNDMTITTTINWMLK